MVTAPEPDTAEPYTPPSANLAGANVAQQQLASPQSSYIEGHAAERPSGAGVSPSPELLAAQTRLLALREARGSELSRRPERPLAVRAPIPEAVKVNWPLRNATLALQQRREELRGELRPQWGGVLLPDLSLPDLTGLEQPLVADLSGLKDEDQTPTAVTAHPTMLLAMLRHNQEAAARLWFLLRAIDTTGRGWIAVDEVRARLAKKGSPWRFCGWRRLRQLLAEGEGVYWMRDKDGILWLRAAYRVAWSLGCRRLEGYPVELPVATLLGGIGNVRATFYAAFHSGREGRPISRETLQALSGLAPRTQLNYDRQARVRARRNIAIGDRHNTAVHQERAWRRGRAVFRFVDVQGQQGRPGSEYVAWHLPNSYEGPHNRRSRSQRKRLNRQLADLVPNGIPGNSETRLSAFSGPTDRPRPRGSIARHGLMPIGR